MATVSINGVTYHGDSIEIRGNVVKIDGKVQDQTAAGVVEIRVRQGILGNLTTDASVSCGTVHGDIHASGSVNCDDVGGDIYAGGSVNCDSVRGRITAGGSVRAG